MMNRTIYKSGRDILSMATLLFFLLFPFFPGNSFASSATQSQMVWDDDLGSPAQSTVFLNYDDTSYVLIHTLGPDSNQDMDLSVVEDNLSVRIAKYDWVNLVSVSRPDLGHVAISLSFSENRTAFSRSIIFGSSTYSSYTTITQDFYRDITPPDPGPGEDPDTGSDDEVEDYTEGLNLSGDRNWILTTLVGDSSSSNVKSVSYFDGLGYLSQDVLIKGSGNCSSDLVTLHSYDYLHRESRTYLPYVKSSDLGSYDYSGIHNQETWYKTEYDIMGSSSYAWLENRYENSARGRLLATTKPGQAYHEYSRESTVSYRGNLSGEVFVLDVDFSTGNVTVSGHYQPSTLSCITVVDEDGRMKSVFKDLEDRVVLERSLVNGDPSGDVFADTYYAYDLLGRLSLVVSPMGSDLLSDGTVIPFPATDADDRIQIQAYCYGYRYDGSGRIVEKIIPDASAVYFVYDSGDRPVMIQDGNLRSAGQWRTIEYDAIGRNVRERIVTSSLTRSSLQSSFSAGTFPSVYTSSSGELLIERTYDAYPSSMPSSMSFVDVPGVTSVGGSTSLDTRALGLLIYEKIDILDGSGMVERAYYYDHRGNVIQCVEQRPGNKTLRSSRRYDRQGRLLSKEDRHVVAGASSALTDILTSVFVYDSSGRIVREDISLSTGGYSRNTTLEYSYDALGRLNERKYGDDLEYFPTETLNYDLQGRLVRQNLCVIDYDAFTSVLHYDDAVNGAVPQYAGNVSSWEWSGKSYAFSYDGLSRLIGAEQYEGNVLKNEFTERNIVYDLNGNLLSLQRSNGSTTPSTITFGYEGNRRLSDSYDANGNVTLDSALGQDASYNILNLPNRMFGVDYYVTQRYLADGTKLETEEDETYLGYYYAGPFRYDNNEGNVNLESVGFSCGRFIRDGASLAPQYYIKDHLGSVRAVADDSGELVVCYDYLPYGTLVNDNVPQDGANRYLYGGKELQERFGIDWYDSSARFQTMNGIFTGIDPFAEKYYSISPYAYCAGNPVNRIDPDGRWDVRVSLYKDRSKYGYGIAYVKNRHGDVVYKFNVRAEGEKGRDRNVEGADTPLGVYDIPDNYPWISGKSRQSYGPYPRLNMVGKEGEILETGRSLIRIHGGRQEKQDERGMWIAKDSPQLMKTQGCLRAYDADMKKFKEIVDKLEIDDMDEKPGEVIVTDDLEWQPSRSRE